MPNEGELDLLVKNPKYNSQEKKAERLLELGVKNVVVTQGARGATLYTANGERRYESVKVEVIDTTAAGDAFAGSLAFGLQQDWDEDRIMNYCNLVAAITVTKLGAQRSLPERAIVEKFIKRVSNYEKKRSY